MFQRQALPEAGHPQTQAHWPASGTQHREHPETQQGTGGNWIWNSEPGRPGDSCRASVLAAPKAGHGPLLSLSRAGAGGSCGATVRTQLWRPARRRQSLAISRHPNAWDRRVLGDRHNPERDFVLPGCWGTEAAGRERGRDGPQLMLPRMAPRDAADAASPGLNSSLPPAEQKFVTETQRWARGHSHGVTVAWPGALPFRWLWNPVPAPWPPQEVGRQRSLDSFKVVGPKADSWGRDLPGFVRLPHSHAGLCSPGGEVLSPPHPRRARPVLLTPHQLPMRQGP